MGWGVKGRNSPTEGGGQLRPVLPVDPPGQGYCNEDTASEIMFSEGISVFHINRFFINLFFEHISSSVAAGYLGVTKSYLFIYSLHIREGHFCLKRAGLLLDV